MSTQLTMAGAALSLGVCYLNIRPWWKSNRDPKDLIPFGSGTTLGAMSTLCAGGLLGWLAGCSVSGANAGGDRVVGAATGAEPGAIATGSLGELTADGGVVVFLVTVGVCVAWRAAGKKDRRRMAGGAFAGCSLTVTAGVSGLLHWLPNAVNTAGMLLHSALEGQL